MADQDHINKADNPGSEIISNLETIRDRIVSINDAIGELTLEKQSLLDDMAVANATILEIFSIGKNKHDTPIDELEFSPATRMQILTALRSINVRTVGDLVKESEESLKKTPTLGKALDEIKSILAKRGFTLK